MAVTTPPVRVSFPTVFKPRGFQNSDPKYSVTMMFDKTDDTHMAALTKVRKEAEAVLEDKWPDPEKRPRIPIVGHDKSPIKDGDKSCNQQGVPIVEKNKEYAGHFIIRAASASKPPVVDRGMEEIVDTNMIYGGCYCKINFNAYAYDVQTNKGVTFGLNGVQFWDDGDAFGGGRRSVGDMFTADSGADDPSNYSDTAKEPAVAADAEIPF